MNAPAIRTVGLSKRFRIGRRVGYKSLRESLQNAATGVFRRRRAEETIWALSDVSFEVAPGEAVGVIGRNGAGKSTLLKIISRITEPTEGRVELRGRVGSLLEVGTGFHLELTGRENIFLSGAILGMKRNEIVRRFDEIVDFAEIERFLNTPVKHYSTGMYLRLAFAVAAHLEPEILLVDEVLAVGDAAFQKKCMGKMGDVARGGRTVLFVSHNLNAVMELCTRAVTLEGGRVAFDGPAPAAVGKYLEQGEVRAQLDLDTLDHKGPRAFARLRTFSLHDRDGRLATCFMMRDTMVARIGLDVTARLRNAEVGLKVSSRYGTAIHYFTSTWEGLRRDLEPGSYVFEVEVPEVLLYPGTYQIGLWVLREGSAADDNVPDVTRFEVVKSDVTGHPTTIEKYAYSGCEVYAPSRWRAQRVEREERT